MVEYCLSSIYFYFHILPQRVHILMTMWNLNSNLSIIIWIYFMLLSFTSQFLLDCQIMLLIYIYCSVALKNYLSDHSRPTTNNFSNCHRIRIIFTSSTTNLIYCALRSRLFDSICDDNVNIIKTYQTYTSYNIKKTIQLKILSIIT